MPKLISKLLISIFAFFILFLSFTSAATASGLSGQSGQWYSQSFDQWYTKVYGGDQNEIFGERYTAAQVSWVFYGLVSLGINLATGNDPAIQQCIVSSGGGNVKSCIDGITALRNALQFKLTSDSGRSKNLFAKVFEDRPLSGITYIKNIGRKFRLVPEAKAAGPGFGYTGALGVIPDIQNAWTVIRDLSYGIFVLVIIAFAFMIMFRVKISPQVVVSVQSALPKIAIALILVTFSYAIAGFLIDIMYVVIGVVSLIFSNFKIAGVDMGTGSQAVVNYFELLTKGPKLFGLPINTGIFGLLFMYIINYVVTFIGLVWGGFFEGLIGPGGIGGSLFVTLTFVIGLIGLVVVFVVMIINFFKILYLLGKTFLIIILLTIFAPLQLTLSVVIPGIGIGAWIKSYAAKLATFVGVGIMFVFSLWFLQFAWNTVNVTTSNQSFAAGWPPLLGGSPQMLGLGFLLASIAVFVMIPRVGDMIEGFVSGKAFNFGTAIGQAVTGPFVGGLRAGGFAVEAGSQAAIIANAISLYREGAAEGGIRGGISNVHNEVRDRGVKGMRRSSADNLSNAGAENR